ncbi:MAG: HigA family addiction module antidote protein [Alphaproteobacteria bacterium]|nr:HigA family addiction module antidote protein [Alphaproteobacteria bacterium]
MARLPIHPGEILRDELEVLRISITELARQLSVPINRGTSILNKKRAITGDIVLHLGDWFGTSAKVV